MSVFIPALAGLLLLTPFAAAAQPVEFIGEDFPSILEGQSEISGKGCSAVRGLKPAEVTGPWAGRIARITMTCKPMPGIDGEPDGSVDAVATVKPGAATFGGVAVAEIRLSESWAHTDSQYVLNGRFEAIGPELIKKVQARCRKRLGVTVEAEAAACPFDRDATFGGYFIGSEGGGTWLHADTDNPSRTIYAEAWSE